MVMPQEGPGVRLVAVAVGNTRTRVGYFPGDAGGGPQRALTLASEDVSAVLKAADELGEDQHDAVIVMSSVNEPAAERLEAGLRERWGEERVYRIGRDVRVPMALALDDERSVGQDRLLCALAAYARAEQACVVIDAGTAVTVDFVDGQGVFQGGVIAPGVAMMLRSLHQGTSALPELAFEAVDRARGPFGKDTRHAMLLGVTNAVRGLVRHTVEAYAERFGAYPQVIATGGDAEALFGDDEVVEAIVPDLQLVGIAETCARTLRDDEDGGTGPTDGEDDL